ncbi:dUTP diphosphatase [Salmonella enterica subsp. enterica serovar 4,[5],12:i:-]|nr:dUTP diphosphatase [Salmonella enterica subsp. enterica serovar 4,[5],12:i:-]
MTNLYIKKLTPVAELPRRATTDSAGLDVRACLWEPTVTVFTESGAKLEREVVAGTIALWPGYRLMIPTGLKMSVDAEYCIKLYPRSGISLKNGLSLINCVGIGDHDYKEEYYVTLTNHGQKLQTIADGERVCQLMVERVEPVNLVEVDELPDVDSERNGGFGSTGNA